MDQNIYLEGGLERRRKGFWANVRLSAFPLVGGGHSSLRSGVNCGNVRMSDIVCTILYMAGDSIIAQMGPSSLEKGPGLVEV